MVVQRDLRRLMLTTIIIFIALPVYFSYFLGNTAMGIILGIFFAAIVNIFLWLFFS